jgi:protein phosphatase 1 regulatory subunit 7
MNNKIRSISGLDNLNTLLELNLSRNLIVRLKGLQGLANLRYLYLSSNLISRAKQVAYISELPFLTDVDFCYNEVQNRKFYRFQILFYLPQLRILDGQEVTYYEKVKADILFGADSDNKKEIFKTFLPEEQFMDRRLFVAEQIDPESDSDEELGQNFDGVGESGKRTQNLINSKNITLSSIYDKRTKDDYMYGESGLTQLNNIKPLTYS